MIQSHSHVFCDVRPDSLQKYTFGHANMCALIHSMSTHLVMLLLYHGPMGQSLVINPHISTKRAPHMLETPRHKGRGEPRSPDQWSVSCFSTIWHAEGFLRYS